MPRQISAQSFRNVVDPLSDFSRRILSTGDTAGVGRLRSVRPSCVGGCSENELADWDRIWDLRHFRNP